MSIPLPQLDPYWSAELAKMIRARDQEIVRCVLEAAENIAIANREPWTARAIRALEFHHE